MKVVHRKNNRIHVASLLLLTVGAIWQASANGAKDMALISITDSIEETNGCGRPGPSASDGKHVILTGTDTDSGCGDDTILQDFIDGSIVHQLSEETEDPMPSISHANEKTGKVLTVGYKCDRWECGATARISSRERSVIRTYKVLTEKVPKAAVILSDGVVAMIYENDKSVTFYDPDHENGKLKQLNRIKLDVTDNPMKTLKTMVYDSAANALYIGGNVEKKGYRGLARIDIKGRGDEDIISNSRGDGDVAWITNNQYTTGTATLHLRRTSFDSPAYEVLLLSRSFFVRVSATNGSERTAASVGSGWMPWLPYGEAPVAAYDPTRDVIWTTADTRLRMHDAETGLVEGSMFNVAKYDLEFYKNPPKSWKVKLKDSNPATDKSKHPPVCGSSPYPDHPNIEKDKFEGISWNNDAGCSHSSSKKCPYPGDDRMTPSCTDSDVCCIYNDCCIFDNDYFYNWGRYPWENGDSIGVHVTQEGKVHVAVQFLGSVDDEESYSKISLATFDDSDSSVGGDCTEQATKTKCRSLVTPTGCYWSSSKGCIEAIKCSRIKKNEEACLAATEHKHECAWWMRREGEYVCNDDTSYKACKVARDKTACLANGCDWGSNGCGEKTDDGGPDTPISDYFVSFGGAGGCIAHNGNGSDGRDNMFMEGCDLEELEKDQLWTLNDVGMLKPFTNIIGDQYNKCVVIPVPNGGKSENIKEGTNLYVVEDCGTVSGKWKNWTYNDKDGSIRLLQDRDWCVSMGASDKFTDWREDRGVVLRKCNNDKDQRFENEEVKPPAWWLSAPVYQIP